MKIIINPGTWAIEGATEANALECVKAFIKDLGADAAMIERLPEREDNGRYGYRLTLDGRSTVVDMPGWPVDRVRFMGRDGQDIWQFPRLYVDGSSWLWKFALYSAALGLFGEDELSD